ncbi:calcium-binding protein [Mesorhizobium sophorae]|uniref:calcium-binding protein n=1 Tax=Mesorhizobium sophorae TaxID=1300294 RepID=UPI00117C057D|nr:calcium-binding protein [Mesorhizobium sophorae]
MAVVDTYIPLDMLNGFNFSKLLYADSYYGNSGGFTAGHSDGTIDALWGYGFAYDINGVPMRTGTVTEYSLYGNWSSDLLIDVSGISVPASLIIDAALSPSTADDVAIVRTALAGADTVYGSDYADVLDGFGGNDTIYCYAGNDIAYGEDGNDYLSGMAGNDYLSGMAGNDYLNGGTGIDTMVGGSGSDTYVVDSTYDVVNESVSGSTGIDTVQSSISFSLSDSAHVLGSVENLTLLGSANINGTGNSIANIITGNSGNNIINGLGGADTMSGSTGNDTYYVDNAGDHVIEANGQGTDNVQAYVSFNLSGQELENLALRSAASINGTGNSIANVITGNSGNNVINGLLGNDTLSGSTGNDSFVFTTALNASSNVDRITDFSVVDDTIRVDNAIFAALGGNGTLTADQFVKNTTGLAGDGNDHIIYETDTGWLYYDSNGSAAGGSTHFATLAANLALTNADFLVI